MQLGAAHDPRDDAALVLAARTGDPGAYGVLFRRWFDRSYDVARGVCRDRETAAEVAQEAFLACWEGLGGLRDPDAFGGWILRTTRNKALNRIERERIRRYEPLEADDEERWPMSDDLADPVRAAEIAGRQHLVRTAAGTLGERDLSLLDLHLRHGLEPAEIADELGITPNNAHQLLFRLRNKLRDAVGAALLWREGRPTCTALASLVPAGAGFDAGVASTVRRHQKDCSPCTAELGRQTHPERLFAALPIAVAPLALRDQVAAELARLGVPVGGDAGAAGGAPGTDDAGADSSSGPGSGSSSGTGTGGGPVPAARTTGPATATLRRGPAMAVAATVLLVTAGAVTAVQLSRQPPLRTTAATSAPAAAASASDGLPVTAPSTAGGTPSAAPSTVPATGSATAPPPSGSPDRRTATPGGSAPTTTPATSTVTPTVVLVAPTAEVTVTGPVDLTAPNRCTGTQLRWLVDWQATAATTASLTAAGRQITVDAGGGSTKLCLAPGDLVELTVEGPGGTASASDTADLSPAG